VCLASEPAIARDAKNRSGEGLADEDIAHAACPAPKAPPILSCTWNTRFYPARREPQFMATGAASGSVVHFAQAGITAARRTGWLGGCMQAARRATPEPSSAGAGSSRDVSRTSPPAAFLCPRYMESRMFARAMARIAHRAESSAAVCELKPAADDSSAAGTCRRGAPRAGIVPRLCGRRQREGSAMIMSCRQGRCCPPQN